MSNKPKLSAEDARIWRAYTQQHVTPLREADMPEHAEDDGCLFEQEMGVGPAKPNRATPPNALDAPLPKAQPKALPALKVGAHARIDAASARQLKRGQKPIEAHLDLHGHRAEEALERLCQTVRKVRAQGGRVLLVITGKGRENTGILRQKLPRWVEDSPLNEQVLAIQPAKPAHGGGGAFYLLLKK